MKNIQLMQGDCLKLLRTLPDSSVDLVLSDPPYGTTACKWDTVIDLPSLWAELKRVIKPNGAVVITSGHPFTSALVMSNPKMFKQSLVWSKNKVTGFLNAKKQHMRKHEDVMVFYKKQPTYNPQKTSGRRPVNSYTKHTSDGTTIGKTKIGITGGGSTDRYPTSILEFPVANQDGSNEDRFHPAQKPAAVMGYLIKAYSNEGETVLDFMAGSFTTGVACVNVNRKFIGIEKNQNYFDIGVNRVRERIKCLDLKIEPEISMGD